MAVLLLFSLLLLAISVAGARIPVHRWQFMLEGRKIEIANYLFHETVSVDGQKIPHTRVGGNHLTWAAHALALPDGRELVISIGSQDGITVRCTARLGEETLFDSRAAPRTLGPVSPTRAALPALTEAPAQSPPAAPPRAAVRTAPTEPRDARWTAAKVLLSSLRADPELGPAAAELGAELQRALARREAAATAAEAHTALGGAAEEVAPILRQREHDVQDLLRVLRELHLAASSRELTATALPRVEDVIDRLRAAHEVDEDARSRAVAALAARLAHKPR